MPNYQKHIVYLSDEQRQELFTNGSITVGGQTVTYSDNDMYVTPQDEPYVKPDGGIPATDLTSSVRTSLEKADTAYQKPSGGIPSTDLASGVIPSVPVQDVTIDDASIVQNGTARIPFSVDDTSGTGDTDKVWSADKSNSEIMDLNHRVDAVEIHETVSTPASVMMIADGADDIPVDNLTVAVEPVQDLHGYENPWPEGGGINLFDKTNLRNTNGYLNSSGEIVSQVSWRVSEYIPVTAGSQITLSGGTTDTTTCCCWYDSNKSFISSFLVKDGTYTAPNNASYICCSVIVTRLDTYQVEYGSTATAYAPYSNICPISGWTGANVTRTGKNLWDGEYLRGAYSANGSFNSSDSYISSKNKIAVKPNTQYYCKYAATTVLYVAEYGVDGSFLRRKTTGSAIGDGQNFATSNDTYYINFSIGGSGAQAITPTEPISINYPSTDTEYHAVTSANTYSITFPSEAGTVYGGTLTINQDGSGSLVVDRAMVDLGDLTWNYLSGSYFYVSLRGRGAKNTESSTVKINNYCSNYKTVPFNQFPNFSVTYYQNNVRIKDPRYTDAASFKTAMDGVAYCFELEESVTYDLTASQITTLLGHNNIFADTGNILSMTYSADPKMYVDQNKGVSDVQVNGTSVVTNGVANVPVATVNSLGVIKPQNATFRILNDGTLQIAHANIDTIKAGASGYVVVGVNNQHVSTFYSLAKAAGDNTQSASANAVGNYTETAKSKISDMLSAPVTVSGTTPSITAMAGVRYICGEVSTLDITVPASGIIDIVFESGSTATVLTVTPPTGMTMKWANGFDPTSLDANTVYEINIMDGCYGVVGSWT